MNADAGMKIPESLLGFRWNYNTFVVNSFVMKKNKITEENEFLLREEMMAYQRTPRSSDKSALETVSE